MEKSNSENRKQKPETKGFLNGEQSEIKNHI